jgi:hypothetical protein
MREALIRKHAGVLQDSGQIAPVEVGVADLA